MTISPRPISVTCEISSALSDEGRARILMALRKQELCVCQIVELLQLAQSTVSKHLLILKHAGLVNQRRSGRWIFYALAAHGDNPVLAWLSECLKADSTIKGDDKRLQRILKEDPEELCRRQCSKPCSSARGLHGGARSREVGTRRVKAS